jgi:hypothetical protein
MAWTFAKVSDMTEQSVQEFGADHVVILTGAQAPVMA